LNNITDKDLSKVELLDTRANNKPLHTETDSKNDHIRQSKQLAIWFHLQLPTYLCEAAFSSFGTIKQNRVDFKDIIRAAVFEKRP